MFDLPAYHPRTAPAFTAPPVRRAPAALALFVGRGCCPGPEEFKSLEHEGLRCLWVATPEQALRSAQSARFDAVVLDAGALESPHGMALAHLRDSLACPLIVIADRGDEVDEIVALELGADAYLSRPVAARRLRAHLGVLLRLRSAPPDGDAAARDPDALSGEVTLAGWHLDRVANKLVSEQASVSLTEVQSALIQCLFEARGRVVPRARLAAALPLGRDLHARSVDVYVHRLRKRLAEVGAETLCIESLRGRGYALRAVARTSSTSLRAVA